MATQLKSSDIGRLSVPTQGQDWYPTHNQLKSPQDLEKAFRQLLGQHYELRNQHNDLIKRVEGMSQSSSSGPPPGSGPTDTMILGLRVTPVDPNKLADGVTLKWNKAKRTFSFS